LPFSLKIIIDRQKIHQKLFATAKILAFLQNKNGFAVTLTAFERQNYMNLSGYHFFSTVLSA